MNSKVTLYYQACVASFTIPHAMIGVLFPYLVSVYLAETPERVAWAITVYMLPSLLMLLIAGAIADRWDKRRLLIILQIVNLLPITGLLIAVWSNQVNYNILLIFALASGAAMTFVQPTLDAMLNSVSQNNIQRAVTTTVGLMYVMSLTGYLFASSLEWLGILPLMILFIIIMAGGILFTLRLPNAPPSANRQQRPAIKDIGEGLKTVFKNKTLLAPILMMGSSGILLGGPYAVLVPLILRDIYHATAIDFSVAFATFMMGGAISSAILLRIGGVKNPWRLLVIGYVMGAVALIMWSLNLPYWGFLLGIFIWGMGGGICLAMSRTILQQSAPAEHRAKVMSVMYFGDEGSAPIGTMLTGYFIVLFGTLQAALIPAAGTIAVALILVILNRKWKRNQI